MKDAGLTFVVDLLRKIPGVTRGSKSEVCPPLCLQHAQSKSGTTSCSISSRAEFALLIIIINIENCCV